MLLIAHAMRVPTSSSPTTSNQGICFEKIFVQFYYKFIGINTPNENSKILIRFSIHFFYIFFKTLFI